MTNCMDFDMTGRLLCHSAVEDDWESLEREDEEGIENWQRLETSI